VVHPTWILSVKQENGLVNIPVGHWRAEFYTYTYTYELCEHYQNSIASKMRSQELLWWAHTAQLKDSNHRGSYQSWVTNYTKTIRQYQALQTAENKLSDQMCVDFLNNSVRGVTHLEGVLDTYYTARKAAGTPDPFDITFEEYVERLIQAAQPY